MPRPSARFASLLLLAAAASGWAQDPGGIYTCVDAQGRRLTSDRPIRACLDREQKVLNPSGTVRRVMPPSLTAVERAAAQARERQAAEQRERQAEEVRRQRALLARYPTRAKHDEERAKALEAIDAVIATAHRRILELQAEHKKLEAETEFYPDPGKWPLKLRRQFDDNAQQAAAQQRFIANQQEEKRRINAQFDEELAQLKVLWAQAAGATSASGTPALRR